MRGPEGPHAIYLVKSKLNNRAVSLSTLHFDFCRSFRSENRDARIVAAENKKRELAEKRQQLADISNLVHDLKALKEIRAIVDAKALSTNDVRDLEDFEKK